jgi:hypothetical protein
MDNGFVILGRLTEWMRPNPAWLLGPSKRIDFATSSAFCCSGKSGGGNKLPKRTDRDFSPIDRKIINHLGVGKD